MNKLMNYLGQLRLYSLIDFMLMLVAAGASPNSPRFWGALDYWVGFLAHLESKHYDKGREPVPSVTPWLFWLYAVTVWKNDDVGFLFIALSFVYAWKKRKPWGLVSPFVRGLQTLVIVGGIAGYNHVFPWLAALLTAVRNWLGDLRDSEDDAEEKIYTWPTKLGWQSRPFAHLFGIFGTTITWWLFAVGVVPVWLLFSMLVIETVTYWRTPRPSNDRAKKAAKRLRSKILAILRR